MGEALEHTVEPEPARPAMRSWRVPLVIAAGVLVIVLAGGLLLGRTLGKDPAALAAEPKAVTTTSAVAAQFQRERRYVGTVAPWVEARIGPQYTSAYVDSVLVRPGQEVKRGTIVGTLDCRNASAQSRAIAMQARALQTTQEALAHEATRVSGLLRGGYVSPNEAEVKTAASQSKQAELLATRAQLMRASREVNDCVLRAPFDGEVADRFMDPGVFARPGSPMIRLVDRRTVRVTADVPENDFDVVAPGRPVEITLVANGRKLSAPIARRSPAADLSTRTVHVEVDLADPERAIPVGTTAMLTVGVGEAQLATVVPASAAVVRGDSASLFTVENGVAHRRRVKLLGEREGVFFLDPSVPAGARVVVQGREALHDGEAVAAGATVPPPTVTLAAPPRAAGAPAAAAARARP